MEVHRILSLDSGGVWAMLQVMALQKLFGLHARGHDVLRRFNLAAASGGGSIVLAGLAMNMTLQEILDEFFINKANREKIFGKQETGFFKKAARILRHEALKDVLGKEYHAKKLGELARLVTEFLICAYDCDRRRPEFFRSANNSRSASSTGSWDPPLVDVIHASATSQLNNAHALAIISKTRFCDGAAGGLYNPVVAAVTEALANNTDASKIQVLSIGTGTLDRPPLDSAEAEKKSDQQAIERDMANAIFNDPADSATYVAHVMLKQALPGTGTKPPIANGSVVRVSPAIRLDGKSAPQGGIDPAGFKSLAAMEKSAVAQRSVDAVRKLGEAWLDDKVGNQPIRSNRNFECEIGHDKASGAIAQWNALAGEVTTRAA
jgi:hypothetical protein